MPRVPTMRSISLHHTVHEAVVAFYHIDATG